MMKNLKLYNYLRKKSQWVWEETLKIHKLAPETRLASSLSDIEIFVTLIYGEILKLKPEDQYWEGRDRFIISKAHGAISLYPILADLGFFSKDELEKVCSSESFLGGIPDPVIPGFETINGSLGHGLGVACGIAFALKQKKSNNKVFVLAGDGELYEGANWEAAMFAAHHKLDNLILIIDCNKISMLGYTKDIINFISLSDKFSSFGWKTFDINGHNVETLYKLLSKLKDNNKGYEPTVIIANTIKGRGVPLLANKELSHVLSITPEEIDKLVYNEK